MGAVNKRECSPVPPEGERGIRQRFFTGRFPVATVDATAARNVSAVLGLVVSRGYNAEEAFFGMLLRAEAKGAEGIVGYRENIAFHPDGSRFYTCYGTAVTLAKKGA